MRRETRIAILGRDFCWGGGVDFLRHITNGLLSVKELHNLKLYLLLPITNHVESPLDQLKLYLRSIKGTVKKKHLWRAQPKNAFPNSMLNSFSHMISDDLEIAYYENSNRGLMRCLNRINADVVLPVSGSLGINFSIPWLGYIYDFQHKYYPSNFSPEECFSREIHFSTILRDAKAIIVNSTAVKNDISKYYPWHDSNRIFELPFSPHLIDDWLKKLDVNVFAKFNLPDKYFLISNQFWLHKDHLTAFKAILRIKNVSNISLVCTGTMNDHRNPNYIEELKQFLYHNKLVDRVRMLGHIPKSEQIEVMKHAIAVIQPTLFEGGPGGGSVYDAVSLGLPVILSDIPVNREVKANNIRYFKPGDDDALSKNILELTLISSNRPTFEKLIANSQNNLSRLGNRMNDAIEYLLARQI